MAIWKAVILGLVQGLTEFLPVSSSGHLVLAKEILGINLESGGMFFDVMLHMGTLLAIFVAFWHDIWKLIVEGVHIVIDCFVNLGRFIQNRFGHERIYRKVIRTAYRKYVVLLIVSTIPTGIIGVVMSDFVDTVSQFVLVPAFCLLITSAFLIIADAVDKGNKTPKDVGYGQAAFVGVAQGVATLPGLSRSGTTITACLLCGFDKRFAVKYSFIMSIPAVLGAVVLELKDFSSIKISHGDMISCAIATVIAAFVGYVAIKCMLALVRGKKYKYFAMYCAVIGIATIIWYFAA